ncbi:MAG: hypothetical protein E5V75_34105 [Mesorhizobium sp.]|nr:MAG: hypothetical protein E5V75_34105 [Mesorhizobium sp.]
MTSIDVAGDKSDIAKGMRPKRHAAVQTGNNAGGILRSRKIVSTDPNWINTLVNFDFAVPTTGTQYVWDISWSDSQIQVGNADGGKGCICRGEGNVSIIGVQFNRAGSTFSGLTLRKEYESTSPFMIIGCVFDACTTYGLTIDGSASPSGTVYAVNISGCNFRNPGGTNDIIFIDHASTVFSGVTINNTTFADSSVATNVSFTAAKWNVNFSAAGWTPIAKTFTPTITFGGAAVGVTYGIQTGRYILKDNLVIFDLILVLTNKGSSTGSVVINGLPKAAATLTGLKVGSLSGFTGLTGAVAAEVSGGGIIVYQQGATGTANLTDASFTNTTNIRLSGAYLVS